MVAVLMRSSGGGAISTMVYMFTSVTYAPGMPRTMMLFALVHQDMGKPLYYCNGEGYALCLTMKSWTFSSIFSVVTPG